MNLRAHSLCGRCDKVFLSVHWREVYVKLGLTSTPSTIPFSKHVSRLLCLYLLVSQGISPRPEFELSLNPGHVTDASPPATRAFEREGKEARKAEDWRNP